MFFWDMTLLDFRQLIENRIPIWVLPCILIAAGGAYLFMLLKFGRRNK